MIRLYYLTMIIAIVSLGIFLLYKEVKTIGKNEIIVKDQEKQLKINNEVIKENKAIRKRKIINNAAPTSDNIVWLQDNFCTDCKD